MSAYTDIYNIWGYPRPVKLVPKTCGCDVDIAAIRDAVIGAIGSSMCSCACINDKIEEAKNEVINTVKETCCQCGSNDDPCSGLCGIEVYEDGGMIDLNEIIKNGGCLCCN